MTDDCLLQEFHEAGIWLPEELEIIKAHKEMAQFRAEAFAKQMQMNRRADLAALQHGVPIGFSTLSGPSQQQSLRKMGFLGGIFGAL